MILTVYRDNREVARYMKADSIDDVRRYLEGFCRFGNGAVTCVVAEGTSLTRYFVIRKDGRIVLMPQRGAA